VKDREERVQEPQSYQRRATEDQDSIHAGDHNRSKRARLRGFAAVLSLGLFVLGSSSYHATASAISVITLVGIRAAGGRRSSSVAA
jgi:hypothetical protein